VLVRPNFFIYLHLFIPLSIFSQCQQTIPKGGRRVSIMQRLYTYGSPKSSGNNITTFFVTRNSLQQVVTKETLGEIHQDANHLKATV
jgi:hypothetical protein